MSGSSGFEVLVDWQNAGNFNSIGDAITSDVRAAKGFKTVRGMDQVRPLGTISAGQIDMDVDNQPGYEQVVLADNPVGYWRFNGSGATINDVSVNANDATGAGSGGTTGNPGPLSSLDPAAYFSGANYATIPNISALRVVGDLTLEAWVMLTNTTNVNTIISEFGAGAAAPYYLNVQPTGAIRLFRGNGTVSASVDSNTGAVALNTWTHVVAVMSGTTVTFYANNVNVGGGTLSTTIGDGGNPIWIGWRSDMAGVPFQGFMGEVAVYASALSASRVAAHYAAASLTQNGQRYSLENRGSLLYGNLKPGRPVYIRAASGGLFVPYDQSTLAYDDASTLWDGITSSVDLWTGILDDVQPHPEQLNQSATLPGLGVLTRLRMTGNSTQAPAISTALYQSITTDQAILHCLEALNFDTTKYVYTTGNITFDWWWVDNQDALTAIQDLVNSEGPGCRLYEDASGNIVFEPHNYRFITARSTASQVTFSDGSAGHTSEPIHSEPFGHSGGMQDIVNKATATYVGRSAKPQAPVYTSTTTVNIQPFAVVTQLASASDPFMNAVVPGSVHTVTITGVPTGGTFTLAVNGGAASNPINYNAMAVDVSNAMGGILPGGGFSPWSVLGTGGPLPTNPVTLTFKLSGVQTGLGPVTVVSNGLTGGISPTVLIGNTGFTVAQGTIKSSTINRSSGQLTAISLQAGSSGAILSAVSLYAQPVTADATFDVSTTIDMTQSIADYGERDYPLQIRNEINANVLQDLVNAIALWWQQPRPAFGITLVGDVIAQNTRYQQCISRQVSDRVTIQAARDSINALDCWIETVGHVATQAGRVLTTSFNLEKILTGAATQPFLLDSSPLDGTLQVLWF